MVLHLAHLACFVPCCYYRNSTAAWRSWNTVNKFNWQILFTIISIFHVVCQTLAMLNCPISCYNREKKKTTEYWRLANTFYPSTSSHAASPESFVYTTFSSLLMEQSFGCKTSTPHWLSLLKPISFYLQSICFLNHSMSQRLQLCDNRQLMIHLLCHWVVWVVPL